MEYLRAVAARRTAEVAPGEAMADKGLGEVAPPVPPPTGVAQKGGTDGVLARSCCAELFPEGEGLTLPEWRVPAAVGVQSVVHARSSPPPSLWDVASPAVAAV